MQDQIKATCRKMYFSTLGFQEEKRILRTILYIYIDFNNLQNYSDETH